MSTAHNPLEFPEVPSQDQSPAPRSSTWVWWISGLLLLATMIGFSLRRGAERLWTLRLLTFEGAIRIGLLLSLAALAWRRL